MTGSRFSLQKCMRLRNQPLRIGIWVQFYSKAHWLVRSQWRINFQGRQLSEIVYGGNHESAVRVPRKPIAWWRNKQKTSAMRSDCSLSVFDEDHDSVMDSIHNPTDWSEKNQTLTRTLSGLFTVVSIENHGSGSMTYSRQNLIGWLARDEKPPHQRKWQRM